MTAVIDEKKLYEVALDVVRRSCTGIAPDVMELLREARSAERNPAARRLLETMIRNAELGREKDRPICQSPGYPALYARLGEGITVEADIGDTFGRAMVELTGRGYLRPSMVQPVTRVNPGDNSGPGVPALEAAFVPGSDCAEFILSFKGCGAELPNVMRVFKPAEIGENAVGIKRFLLETVVEAGGIPCPPTGIGIGLGGQMHSAGQLSRQVTAIRAWTDTNPDPLLASLEADWLAAVNVLGMGPGGTGGDTTALTVKIGMAATHTAICPVAINFHCWVARRAGVRIAADGSVSQLTHWEPTPPPPESKALIAGA
ncbi:MAG: fumarate hydratase [Planctomycetota bacterium]|jgi:fumarate hydratase subunit alpha